LRHYPHGGADTTLVKHDMHVNLVNFILEDALKDQPAVPPALQSIRQIIHTVKVASDTQEQEHYTY